MKDKLPNNICLIGMPGAGKTTVGTLLASRTGKAFVDTDDLIRSTTGCSLQYIVDQDGYRALRKIEQDVITMLDKTDSIISTGGSAVYSASAMSHLAGMATLVYLAVPFEIIEERIRDLDTRGLARRADQSLAELYAERMPLYERYADLRIDASDTPENVAESVLLQLVPAWTSQ